ncbi:hypothetical protein F5146DRAFT_1104504 [Armillaria mellea]|nr:hypothetical protein F5146DRAFT_1104504 [Armillaria mellea]
MTRHYMNNEIWSLIADKGALSPQDVHDRILDSTSDFQTKIINWLEGCHTGDFFMNSKEEVWAAVDERSKNRDYIDPTLRMPVPPPPCCTAVHDNCPKCDDTKHWESEFKTEVDDLIVHSNVHDCERYQKKDGSYSQKKTYTGCKDNKYKKCRARFPRKLYSTTEVDIDSGSLNIKKCEPWINTLTPELTYVMCCNSDVTSLSSGTAIKAVVLYISNYITKSSLKTHVVFDVIRDIFAKSTDRKKKHIGSLGRL